MKTVTLLACCALLVPTTTSASAACEAAKERAVGVYSRCLLVADAKHTKESDDATRSIRQAKCRKRFDSAMAKAERGTCGDAHSNAEVAQAVEQAVDALRSMVESGPTVTCPIEAEIDAALTLVELGGPLGVLVSPGHPTDAPAIIIDRLPDRLGAYCGRLSEDLWLCGAGNYAQDLLSPGPEWSDLPGAAGVWQREMSEAEGMTCAWIISDVMHRIWGIGWPRP